MDGTKLTCYSFSNEYINCWGLATDLFKMYALVWSYGGVAPGLFGVRTGHAYGVVVEASYSTLNPRWTAVTGVLLLLKGVYIFGAVLARCATLRMHRNAGDGGRIYTKPGLLHDDSQCRLCLSSALHCLVLWTGHGRGRRYSTLRSWGGGRTDRLALSYRPGEDAGHDVGRSASLYPPFEGRMLQFWGSGLHGLPNEFLGRIGP